MIDVKTIAATCIGTAIVVLSIAIGLGHNGALIGLIAVLTSTLLTVCGVKVYNGTAKRNRLDAQRLNENIQEVCLVAFKTGKDLERVNEEITNLRRETIQMGKERSEDQTRGRTEEECN